MYQDENYKNNYLYLKKRHHNLVIEKEIANHLKYNDIIDTFAN